MVILIGYLQIFIICLNNTKIYLYYDKLSKFLNVESLFVESQRITLTTSESSLAAALLSIYIIPFLVAKFLTDKHNKIKDVIIILSLFPLIYFMKSSSMYISGGILFLIILFYCFKRYKVNTSLVFILFICIFLVNVFININFKKTDYINENGNNSIKYLVLDKLSDKKNTSTVHRSTTIYTSIKILRDYPILGVGNGNQGFFYIKYFPNWGFYSSESRDYYYGLKGWPGSGAFLQTYATSYGIVGIFILIFIVFMFKVRLNNLKKCNNFIYYLITISFFSFVIMSITTINIEVLYYPIFIFSLVFKGEIEYEKK